MKLFIGNLPINTKVGDIRKHILDNVSDIEEDSIISVSVVSNKKGNCHGSVTVKCDADVVISKLNKSTINDRKIKVALYNSRKKKKETLAMSKQEDDTTVKLHHSYSQAQIQDVEFEEVHVIAMANPPLTYQVSDDVLMEHFNQFNEHVKNVECFKCYSREFYKIRLTFLSRDCAKTAIIRMNGSMLLSKHKLKLQFEQSTQRRHSLPTERSDLHSESFDHHSKVSALSPLSDIKSKIPPIDEVTSSSKQSPSSHSHKQSIHSKRRSRKYSSSSTSAKCKSDTSSVGKENEPEATSKLVCKPCKSKCTKVIFQSACVITRCTFQEYLEDYTSGIQFEITDLRSQQGGVEIDVVFSSQNQAKTVLKQILRHDPNLKGHISGKYNSLSDGSTQRKAIDDFRKSIASKTEYFASKYQDKKDSLQTELKNINSKRPTGKHIPLKQFELLESERKIVRQHINECERHYFEFTSFCTKLLDDLELFEVEASETSMETISKARKSFGRECNRYQSALPMYAYRKDITEIVLASRVTIVIGETGSGKSTQLAQYLYEAGLGDSGIIACTQPRKVAAISLAKHVSTEMGCTLGHELGYKTGLRGKYSEKTRVLYMTDHTLLNECIADPEFSKYSCLIIDEAHERSLSTDLLLAFIKQCLPSRPDLKVIITSATIDPYLFVRFFGDDCPVITVPGRIYPVDVIYCYESDSASPIDRDYVKDAVEQACKLHDSEPFGDFIVFLTSAVEIERCCQLASNKLGESAIVLPLHGKLQPEDQQKVFKEYEKRKIIFATNVAETSVTISGVKCIIDTGLAKELCFDPKKNMNSLEVRLISKSSAEQRKGRAGRTSSGKCYRLYSENVYKTMSKKSLPEILRVTLASTVLKLYEFGVKDVIRFNFVEEPDRATLEAAVDSLTFLGAIEDDQLTELGKKMAALPIDPHHSKILFDGIEMGIGNEAVTAVTISTLAGAIFFRAGSDEIKSESDMKTIEFCHPAGDQITYLHTYYQWSLQKGNEQTKWCVTNFVNAKSMRIVKETVTELKDILKQKFHITLPNCYDLKRAEEILPKLYFDSFIWHLSVYLGHERVGYLNERHLDNQFVIFPGSPLRHLNELPEMLIYEKTLITTQHFLLQVLPVREEWVQEAIQLGKLKHHPLKSDLYSYHKVSPLIIPNVGPHIQFTLRKWQTTLEIEKGVEVKPVFEYFRDKGQVSVVVQNCYHTTVREVLQAQINNIREELSVQVQEYGVTEDIDNVRIVIGAGGLIKYILMPDEYRTVMLRTNDCNDYDFKDKLHEQVLTYGSIERCDHKMFRKEQALFVTFCRPEDAMKCIQMTLPEKVTIEPRMYKTRNSQQFSLQIEWNRRKRERFAFIEFSNEENLTIAEQQLCLQFSRRGFRGVAAIKYQKSRDESQIYATNVDTSLTDQEIKLDILSRLPMMNEGDLEVKLGYQKSFETPKHKVDMLKQQMHELITAHVRRDQYTLFMNHPQNQHRTFKVRIQFSSPTDGQKVFEALQDVLIDNEKLNVTPLLSSIISYSKATDAVISEPLKEAIKSIQEDHPSVTFNFERAIRGCERLRISSDDVNTFMTAKRLLEEAVGPLAVDCSHTPVLREFIRSRRCRQMLEGVKSKTLTFTFPDYQTSSIKIYGTKSNMRQAYEQIVQFLAVFKDGVQCYEISIKNGRPPGLMKYLLSKFDPGLKQLENKMGVSSVHLNPSRQVLTLFASENGFDEVSTIIEDCSEYLKSAIPVAEQRQDLHNEIECCVCYTGIKSSGDIFRLEYCGHVYCRECMSLQVSPSVLSFPVECAADQCSKPLVWKDFVNLSQRISLDLHSFLAASLRSHAAANPNLVRYCPTPDCPVVYTVSHDIGKHFFCAHCGTSTCTKCHDTYHEGISCEQNKASKESNKEVDEWMQKNKKSRKRCPKCNIPIEKNKGCNHIHCRQCSADICWVCLKYFDTPNDCYAHLHDQHKGLWD